MFDLSKVTITPMLKQYLSLKEAHTDCILFFRLGDFYEMFLDDALIASKAIDLTLTGRGKDDNRIPMCGLPYHAAENYIIRLVKQGHKVAICEQVEDASESKGLTKRKVTQIITPGTILKEDALEAKDSNYIASIHVSPTLFGLSFVDCSTGEFKCSVLNDKDEVESLLLSLEIKELIVDEDQPLPFTLEGVLINTVPFQKIDRASDWLKMHFKVHDLSAFGIDGLTEAFPAMQALLAYLGTVQKDALDHIRWAKPYYPNSYLLIDNNSVNHLELVTCNSTNTKKGSLFWVLNHCKTAMGARRLKQLIKTPFVDKNIIEKRHNFLESLYGDILSREEVRDQLQSVYDIERLVSRISTRHNNPKDLLALKQSLDSVSQLPEILSQLDVQGFDDFFTFFSTLNQDGSDHQTLHSLITSGINENCPQNSREGGLINPGYSQELDDLLLSFKTIRDWINSLEERERARTGIKALKVGYNKVFGYYFQLSHSYKGDIPEDYIRKQTLSNAERYINPELKEKETLLFNGEEKQNKLESRLYEEIVNKVKDYIPYLQKLAFNIAELDCFQSLANVSQKNSYSRPIIEDDNQLTLELKGNRHPVLEQNRDVQVIPNDIILNQESRFILITGPNMAGKSTLMRQVALTVVMAQMGCFVPCERAKLSIVDKLFTRIGASDNLYSGQSTFMTEMLETSKLLHNSTKNSLIILDEIGRGTSTYDGISIAGAVTEYIHNVVGARTLFATHYHELTGLNTQLSGLRNGSMSISEDDGKLVFTYHFKSGPADKSYGIHVAEMAGLPNEVINRAKQLLEEFESDSITHNQLQLTLF
ncbi:DNA mismatch repair protein MutS [Candidatus Marinamargulisbacteria bacterium SCGC AAA071-K20]|nr:DNA mismatch repair protein MutS [Candidatus Marinamargulisbacteria bacterium SCGC AAA071-K20]